MINNKGQALVFLVILIPLILLVLGAVIELGILSYNKTKVISSTKSVMASCLEKCSSQEVLALLKDNNINYKDANIDINNPMKISYKTQIASFLGSIINKKYYEIKVDLVAYEENGRLVYKKG